MAEISLIRLVGASSVTQVGEISTTRISETNQVSEISNIQIPETSIMETINGLGTTSSSQYLALLQRK
jgi:hypothetical protein